jgi:Lon protease-like protein
MSELGLFPLSIVLLPSEHVPLHIFEPRYRELIGECIAEETEFGLLYEEGDVRSEIGTRAAVVSVIEHFPDGRLNIIVEGRDRFRIVEATSGRSFETAKVESVADDVAANDVDRASAALLLFAHLLELVDAKAETPERDAPQLSFAIASHFELAAELKIELLTMTSEPDRLERVIEVLEGASHAIERQREISARAQTNGRH